MIFSSFINTESLESIFWVFKSCIGVLSLFLSDGLEGLSCNSFIGFLNKMRLFHRLNDLCFLKFQRGKSFVPDICYCVLIRVLSFFS